MCVAGLYPNDHPIVQSSLFTSVRFPQIKFWSPQLADSSPLIAICHFNRAINFQDWIMHFLELWRSIIRCECLIIITDKRKFPLRSRHFLSHKLWHPRTPVRVSKMNAVARSWLTFQMLTLLLKYPQMNRRYGFRTYNLLFSIHPSLTICTVQRSMFRFTAQTSRIDKSTTIKMSTGIC